MQQFHCNLSQFSSSALLYPTLVYSSSTQYSILSAPLLRATLLCSAPLYSLLLYSTLPFPYSALLTSPSQFLSSPLLFSSLCLSIYPYCGSLTSKFPSISYIMLHQCYIYILVLSCHVIYITIIIYLSYISVISSSPQQFTKCCSARWSWRRAPDGETVLVAPGRVLDDLLLDFHGDGGGVVANLWCLYIYMFLWENN